MPTISAGKEQLAGIKLQLPPGMKPALPGGLNLLKASLPKRRLPENVLKSSGSNHKITVYVKYEEQLKEGCVDSDGKILIFF